MWMLLVNAHEIILRKVSAIVYGTASVVGKVALELSEHFPSL